MSTATRINSIQGTLRAFSPRHAATICGWIRTPPDLQWLAPSEKWPLTPQKVIGWKREGGWAYAHECATSTPGGPSQDLRLLVDRDTTVIPDHGCARLLAYGELNPMRGETGHYWLGHVIVDPQFRGHGIGADFVRRVIQRGEESFGVRRVSLIVFPENTAAVACYRSAGFREAGEEFHRCATVGVMVRLVRMEYRAGV